MTSQRNEVVDVHCTSLLQGLYGSVILCHHTDVVFQVSQMVHRIYQNNTIHHENINLSPYQDHQFLPFEIYF